MKLEKSKQKEYIYEAIFLFCIFIFYFLWAYVQDLNISPDELMRYQIPEYICKYGRLPHGGEEAIRHPLWGISYGFSPILSYMISAVFMKVTGLFTTSPQALLMSARMVSTLFGVGTVWCAIRIGKKLFAKSFYSNLFIVLVALLPQAVFITSYVNNDSMAIFSTALIVFMWICGMESNWSYKACIGLAIGISICALSYYNAYGFILCSIILFFMSYWLSNRQDKNVKEFLKKGCLISIIVLLLTGWWFIRNYIIYDGDILGLSISNQYAKDYAAPEFKPSNRATSANQGLSLYNMLFKQGWLMVVYRSFIGCFGFMAYNLPTWMYAVYTIIFGGGLIGCVINTVPILRIRKNSKWNNRAILSGIMLTSCIIPNLLNMYYSYTSDFQPQGRYSLPMLIPFMYFVVLGIEKILEKIMTNEKVKKIIIYSCVFVVILIAILSYLLVFLPNSHV